MANRSVIVKVIQHTPTATQKETKIAQIGDVEFHTVSEVAPAVGAGSQHTPSVVSSDPSRVPTVVRIVTTDPSLQAATGERVIKRQRIGDVVIEQIAGALEA